MRQLDNCIVFNGKIKNRRNFIFAVIHRQLKKKKFVLISANSKILNRSTQKKKRNIKIKMGTFVVYFKLYCVVFFSPF